jgi:hypothetical protein
MQHEPDQNSGNQNPPRPETEVSSQNVNLEKRPSVLQSEVVKAVLLLFLGSLIPQIFDLSKTFFTDRENEKILVSPVGIKLNESEPGLSGCEEHFFIGKDNQIEKTGFISAENLIIKTGNKSQVYSSSIEGSLSMYSKRKVWIKKIGVDIKMIKDEKGGIFERFTRENGIIIKENTCKPRSGETGGGGGQEILLGIGNTRVLGDFLKIESMPMFYQIGKDDSLKQRQDYRLDEDESANIGFKFLFSHSGRYKINFKLHLSNTSSSEEKIYDTETIFNVISLNRNSKETYFGKEKGILSKAFSSKKVIFTPILSILEPKNDKIYIFSYQ